jgi:hypothetical protein
MVNGIGYFSYHDKFRLLTFGFKKRQLLKGARRNHPFNNCCGIKGKKWV